MKEQEEKVAESKLAKEAEEPKPKVPRNFKVLTPAVKVKKKKEKNYDDMSFTEKAQWITEKYKGEWFSVIYKTLDLDNPKKAKVLFHPDKYMDEGDKEIAESIFKIINEVIEDDKYALF